LDKTQTPNAREHELRKININIIKKRRFLTIVVFKLFPGYIADSTGSYAPAFYVAGSCILTGASLFFMIYFFHKQAEKETKAQSSLVVVEKVTVV